MTEAGLHLTEGIREGGCIVLLDKYVLDTLLAASLVKRREVKPPRSAGADASVLVVCHVLEMDVLQTLGCNAVDVFHRASAGIFYPIGIQNDLPVRKSLQHLVKQIFGSVVQGVKLKGVIVICKAKTGIENFFDRLLGFLDEGLKALSRSVEVLKRLKNGAIIKEDRG